MHLGAIPFPLLAFLALVLFEVDDLDVLLPVLEVLEAEGSEEHVLELPRRAGVVRDQVDGHFPVEDKIQNRSGQ